MNCSPLTGDDSVPTSSSLSPPYYIKGTHQEQKQMTNSYNSHKVTELKYITSQATHAAENRLQVEKLTDKGNGTLTINAKTYTECVIILTGTCSVPSGQ